MLETDACLEGLGDVLPQLQDNGHLHPTAYASRALAPSERNYGVGNIGSGLGTVTFPFLSLKQENNYSNSSRLFCMYVYALAGKSSINQLINLSGR